MFRRRGEHRSSAERSPKYGTRRCKFAKPNRVRICIGVVLSIASAADERCSPLHTHPPVVAHDSQGTSCASHMRQLEHACITSDRSKHWGCLQWRFATGRCGHRPLRGVYGCTHVRSFLETPIRFFLCLFSALQSSGIPCKSPNKMKSPRSSEPRVIQKG